MFFLSSVNTVNNFKDEERQRGRAKNEKQQRNEIGEITFLSF